MTRQGHSRHFKIKMKEVEILGDQKALYVDGNSSLSPSKKVHETSMKGVLCHYTRYPLNVNLIQLLKLYARIQAG